MFRAYAPFLFLSNNALVRVKYSVLSAYVLVSVDILCFILTCMPPNIIRLWATYGGWEEILSSANLACNNNMPVIRDVPWVILYCWWLGLSTGSIIIVDILSQQECALID